MGNKKHLYVVCEHLQDKGTIIDGVYGSREEAAKRGERLLKFTPNYISVTKHTFRGDFLRAYLMRLVHIIYYDGRLSPTKIPVVVALYWPSGRILGLYANKKDAELGVCRTIGALRLGQVAFLSFKIKTNTL